MLVHNDKRVFFPLVLHDSGVRGWQYMYDVDDSYEFCISLQSIGKMGQ